MLGLQAVSRSHRLIDRLKVLFHFWSLEQVLTALCPHKILDHNGRCFILSLLGWRANFFAAFVDSVQLFFEVLLEEGIRASHVPKVLRLSRWQGLQFYAGYRWTFLLFSSGLILDMVGKRCWKATSIVTRALGELIIDFLGGIFADFRGRLLNLWHFSD